MDLMSESPEEAARSDVQERDFSCPRRLSRGLSQEILQSIQITLPGISDALTALFDETTKIEITGIREANAEKLIDQVPKPLTAMRFTVGGQPGWITWDNVSAIRALNKVFSIENAEASARRLSRVENRVLEDLLSTVLEPAAKAFGLEPRDKRIISEDHELGDWKSGEPAHADYHRLVVDFQTEGALELATISLYLPGMNAAEAEDESDASSVSVPGHLEKVELEVSARLGTTEIALSDLLALEDGDVVPLDVPIGTPVQLIVQDQLCGEGVLGRHHGKIAVRITDVALPRMQGEPNHE